MAKLDYQVTNRVLIMQRELYRQSTKRSDIIAVLGHPLLTASQVRLFPHLELRLIEQLRLSVIRRLYADLALLQPVPSVPEGWQEPMRSWLRNYIFSDESGLPFVIMAARGTEAATMEQFPQLTEIRSLSRLTQSAVRINVQEPASE